MGTWIVLAGLVLTKEGKNYPQQFNHYLLKLQWLMGSVFSCSLCLSIYWMGF